MISGGAWSSAFCPETDPGRPRRRQGVEQEVIVLGELTCILRITRTRTFTVTKSSRSFQDQIAGLFADHDRGRVRVARHDLGHDRTIHDAQPGDAVHP